MVVRTCKVQPYLVLEGVLFVSVHGDRLQQACAHIVYTCPIADSVYSPEDQSMQFDQNVVFQLKV